MGIDTTPGSDQPEPEARNDAPAWFLILMLVLGVGGVFWVLLNFFNLSGTL